MTEERETAASTLPPLSVGSVPVSIAYATTPTLYTSTGQAWYESCRTCGPLSVAVHNKVCACVHD